MKYVKNPVVVEAMQYNGNSNKQEIDKFVGKELKSELESETAYVAGKGPPIFSLLIETKEGVMKAFKGDWIIKEPFPTGDRDFYPCKPDIFEKTYSQLQKQAVDYQGIRKRWQGYLDEIGDNHKLKTDEQILDQIAQFGFGEMEFHTLDVEILIQEKKCLQQAVAKSFPVVILPNDNVNASVENSCGFFRFKNELLKINPNVTFSPLTD